MFNSLIDVPFQWVAVDLVGPIQPATNRGNRYISTLVNFATQYLESVSLNSKETVLSMLPYNGGL